MSKIVLDLSTRHDHPAEHKPGSHCCRTNMVICPGYGDKDFDFPTVEEAVSRSLARLDEQQAAEKNGAGKGKGAKTARPDGIKAINVGFLPGLPNKGTVPSHAAGLIPQTTASIISGVDATLFAAAEGIRLEMDEGKFDAIVAERFDDISDKVAWALAAYPKHRRKRKLIPAIKSLWTQVQMARKLYHEAVPRLHSILIAQNPDVSEKELLDAAIDVLDKELAPLLSVLRIWTDAVGQDRSGNYPQLDAVVFAVEQGFYLFEGQEPGSEAKDKLKTTKYHVGNSFVARFSHNGPATLPATRGPIGAHAIEVPHDERGIIMLMLALYLHEFRHDIFADVEGLGDELTMVVARAIAEACEKGEVKLSQDSVLIERSKVPMANVLVKLFADTIGEVDADISGGILLCGPAYLYNMISTFSAFNSKPEGVFKQNRLLRTGSYFSVKPLANGQKTVEFWPHPPDYIRAHIVAAALDEIGFPAEATQCRLIADQAVGVPIPDVITWKSDNPKSKSVIRIPIADLKAVAPVVAKALIRTPLQSLGGLATAEVINWNANRQAKVDRLVQVLMSGSSDLPADIGDVYATYVAAAATLAYWGLVKSGVPAMRATKFVELHALAMLDKVRARFEDMEQGLDGGSVELTDGSDAPVVSADAAANAPAGDGKQVAGDGGVCYPDDKTGCRGGTVTK